MRKRQRRLRVGVLEPDDDLRELLFELLEDEGFDVCAGTDWAGLPASCHPDVILTDSDDVLPGHARLAQQIELLHDQSDGHVVVLSDDAATRHDLVALDGAVVLAKPFEIEELLTLLTR